MYASLLATTLLVGSAASPSGATSPVLACQVIHVSPSFRADHVAFCLFRINATEPEAIAVTADGGRTWATQPMTGLTRPTGPAGVGLSLALSPTYATDASLFATTGSGTFVSKDRAATFSQVDSLMTGWGVSNPLVYLAESSPAGFPQSGAGKRVLLLSAEGVGSARTDPSSPVHSPVVGIPGGRTVRFALPDSANPFALGYDPSPSGTRTLSSYRCTPDFTCAAKLFSFPPDVAFPVPGDERVEVLGDGSVVVVLLDGAHDTHVWRSTDAGASFVAWTPVEKLLSPVNKTSESFPFVSLGSDPGQPKVLYLRLSGRTTQGRWSKDAPPAEQLFRSSDRGVTWRRIGYQRDASQAGPRGNLPWNAPASGSDPAGVYPSPDGLTVFAVGSYIPSGEANGYYRSVFCSHDQGMHWRTSC